MRILITNDDGIQGEGLLHLVKWAQKLGEVVVAAPKVEQSAKSHSIQIHDCFEVKQVDYLPGVTAYAVDSSPADCVRIMTLGLKQQFKIVMADESFRKLMVPNFMRGITLSVSGCVVLFALVMGIDESGRAKIPLVCAAATVLSSVVYLLLSKKLSTATINIIGGVLTCAMIFMPYGNTAGFLALFFISYLGRIIVDNAVPTMLFPLIDPKIAGSYNAWRCVLYNLCSIIATPIISVLVEKIDPLWLLIPGTVTYVIVTVWYYIVCKKLTKAQ